jgi:DNA-binding GntR family transcriptional regulator
VTNSSRPGRSESLLRIRLTDQITATIKKQIFDGYLKPGDRVIEQTLARRLGVGQNAIREALIELAHAGFVTRIPNRGTYITQIAADDAENIGPVRAALELLSVEMAAVRSAKVELTFTKSFELLAMMRQQIAAGRIEDFYRSDLEFHRCLWDLANNRYLKEALEKIVVPLFAFLVMTNIRPRLKKAKFLEAVQAHEQVLRAVQAGNPGLARKRMERLLSEAMTFLVGVRKTS